ncbi:class I SAM-dependent methyltransferase [Glutamicibacter sp. MNS18]|uniref:class I SAM-dependent methyltransferase n=1 Tax=Glutamicibacter sp. MNS18 TaxID=2989817 RepID=UPI002236221A|nr:class I SAM-dependent methyltransferase [Glutamicibacter sp. MNS18]MCW4465239.1 class I SAM-dependent methyltransferase [Glutamicibacter sp. MNS18]
MASLILHYLEDWVEPLLEIRRVLRSGGLLVLSVNHPILYPWNHPGPDYFRVTRYTDEMDSGGVPASLTYWRRPLHDMSAAFGMAEFRIESIVKPPYSKGAPERIIPENLKDSDA